MNVPQWWRLQSVRARQGSEAFGELDVMNLRVDEADFQMADDFCQRFRTAPVEARGVFGRNEYARSIAGAVEVGFFVDDFTPDREFLGKPVVKTGDIPAASLVVSSVALGRPRTVAAKLDAAGCRHLDYFQFFERSGLPLLPVTFWQDVRPDFEANEARYREVFERLADAESKRTFERLLAFRLSADLNWMEGFTDRQREQYFEDFLELAPAGETFVDVGGFDGFTTLEFVKRCPDYARVCFFEPDADNLAHAKTRLSALERIDFYPYGLSNEPGVVRFSTSGSASSISDDGDQEIQVRSLDRLFDHPVSFIKMDIEGAEGMALEGARETILAHHPRLAVCVYHKAADLWQLPQQVLRIRDDYRVFLRHYTEGVTETVMFFVP